VSTSKILPGSLDREPPRVFDTQPKMNGKFLAGSVINVEFSEPIACSKPFDFKISIEVSLYKNYTKASSEVLILCSRNKISLTLQKYIDFTKWEGRDLKVKVSGVKDLVGNAMKGKLIFTFGVFRINHHQASMLVERLTIPEKVKIPHTKMDKTRMHNQILAEISQATELQDPSRISELSVVPSKEGLFVNFNVKPANSKTSSKQAEQTALEVVEKLHKLIGSKKISSGYLQHAVVSPDTFLSMLSPSAEDEVAFLRNQAGAQPLANGTAPVESVWLVAAVVSPWVAVLAWFLLHKYSKRKENA